ncbi:unnamed protein product, partial [Ostreobium quekettii]
VRCEWGLTDQQESLLTVWVFVGLLIGALLWGALADILGRKVSLMAATVGGILTSTVAAVTPTIGWLQFMFGMMGFTFAGQFSGLTYLLEFVPAAHRGRWGVAAGLFWSTGILGNAATAWLVLPWHGWRGLMVVTNLPYIVVLVLFPFVPESAHYLVAAGRPHQALKSLQWAARLNGANLPEGQLLVPKGDDLDDQPRNSLVKIRKFLADTSRLVSKPLLLTTVLVMILYVCANVVYNIILLLTTQIHTKHTSTCVDRVFSLSAEDFEEVLIVSSADFTGTFLPILIIDFIGRKWSMFTLSGGVAASLLPVLIAGAAVDPTWSLFAARGLTSAWNNVLTVYSPEVFPTEIRVASTGMGKMFAAFGSMPAGFVAQGMFDAYGIRASVAVLIALTCFGMVWEVCLPLDTTGKPLQGVVGQKGEGLEDDKEEEEDVEGDASV